MKSVPHQANWTVQSAADNSGRRLLTISNGLTHPNTLRSIPNKRRRRAVLTLMTAPEELTAFTPVIDVRR